MIEMTMGGLVLGVLALVTAYLWKDWRTNTREFREMRRLMMQRLEEDRQRGETND